MKLLKICMLLGLLSILGCAQVSKLVQPPKAKIESVNISDISFNDITLNFGFLVNNPNAFSVKLSSFTYQFFVDDFELLKGEQNSPINLEKEGTGTINLPLTLNFQDIYNLKKQSKDNDSLSYTISGSIKPAGLLSEFNIPFKKSGHLPNVRIPKISLANLKVEKFGLGGLDMKLALNIQNPNNFSFNLGKFNYEINLAESQVISGITEKAISFEKKGSSEIVLPIKISFSELTSSLKNIINGKDMTCGFKANTAIDSPFGKINLPIELKENIKIFR